MAFQISGYCQTSTGDRVSLSDFDEATTQVVQTLVSAFPDMSWHRIRYWARWTPSGDVGADDYWIEDENGTTTKVLPDLAPAIAVSDASKHHWRVTQELGQQRWYKMIVEIERSGKYTVDFQYKNDYKEGDIMQPG
jgi:hypothetical protein